MSLVLQALCVSALMGVSLALPRLHEGVRRRSRDLLLVGTGALVVLVLADLLPEVAEAGGWVGIGVTALAAAAYAAVHLLHIGHHDWGHHSPGWEPEVRSARATGFLLAALIAHTFASGMFLALSHDLSEAMSVTVFAAMLAHKGYESLVVALVLSPRSQGEKLSFLPAGLAAYLASFPVGAAAAYVLVGALQGRGVGVDTVHFVAVTVSGLALGSFLGCLLHDFVLPSVQEIRRRPVGLAWLALGALATVVVQAFAGH